MFMQRGGEIEDLAAFLENRLEGYREEFVGIVMDALEDYEMDKRRRAYK